MLNRAYPRQQEMRNKASWLVVQGSTGATLIELMIVIVVLAIALAIGMPSYSQWIQNTHIRNATESIQNGLQRARAEAVSRNVSTSLTLGNGVFWTLTDLNNNQIIETRPAAEIPQSVSLLISPAGGGALPTTTLTFTSIGTIATNADGSASITQIDVSTTALSAADSRPLRIVLGVGGVVRMCDPNSNVAATDPRHC